MKVLSIAMQIHTYMDKLYVQQAIVFFVYNFKGMRVNNVMSNSILNLSFCFLNNKWKCL